MKKTTQIVVRATLDERRLWKKVALINDKTLSEWVRELLEDAARKEWNEVNSQLIKRVPFINHEKRKRKGLE